MSQETKDIELNTEENGKIINATREENEDVINYIQKRDRKNAVKKFIKENRGVIAGFAAMCAAQALYNVAKNHKK